MLSSVLNSKRAVQMNILIMRAFVQIRELLATNRDLAARVAKLEAGQQEHSSIIGILAEEIDQLKLFPEPRKRPFGFRGRMTNHDTVMDDLPPLRLGVLNALARVAGK